MKKMTANSEKTATKNKAYLKSDIRKNIKREMKKKKK